MQSDCDSPWQKRSLMRPTLRDAQTRDVQDSEVGRFVIKLAEDHGTRSLRHSQGASQSD